MKNENSEPIPKKNTENVSNNFSATQRTKSDTTEIEAGPSGVANNAAKTTNNVPKPPVEGLDHDVNASGSSSPLKNSKKRKKIFPGNVPSMRRSKRLKADADKQARCRMLISSGETSTNSSELSVPTAVSTSENLQPPEDAESNQNLSAASNVEANVSPPIHTPEQNSFTPSSNFSPLTFAEVPSYILPNLADTPVLQSISDNNSDHVFQSSSLNPDLSALELDPTGTHSSHPNSLISNSGNNSDHVLQSAALNPDLSAFELDPAGHQSTQPGSVIPNENLFLGAGQHAPGISGFFVSQAELNNSPDIATIDVVTETVTGSASGADGLPQLLTATPLTLSPAEDPLEQQYLKNNTNTSRVNEILSSIQVPAAGKRMPRGHLRKTGDYLLGPCLGSSPVHSIVQCLARKVNTDEFYTLKILTIHESDVETQDDRQGKMLLHTEHSLLSMLANHPGVIRMHALFQDYSYEVVRHGSVFYNRNLSRRDSGRRHRQDSSGVSPPTTSDDSGAPRRDASARSSSSLSASSASLNNRGSAFSAMAQSRTNRIHSTTRSRRNTSYTFPSSVGQHGGTRTTSTSTHRPRSMRIVDETPRITERSRSNSSSSGSSGQRSTAPDTRSLRSNSNSSGVRDSSRTFAIPSSRLFHHHLRNNPPHHYQRSNAALVSRPSSRRSESGVADWRLPRASSRYRRTLHNILDGSYRSSSSRSTRYSSMLQRPTASSLSTSSNSSNPTTTSSVSRNSAENANATVSTSSSNSNNSNNNSNSSDSQAPVFLVPRVPPITRRNNSGGNGGSRAGGRNNSGGNNNNSSGSSRSGSNTTNQNPSPGTSRTSASSIPRRTYRYMDGVYTGRVVRRLCLVLDCVTPHDFSSKTDHLMNLQHYVIARQALPEHDALAIFFNAAEIVHSLHEVNIVHRDLKLGNLVVEHATHKVTLTNLCLGQHLMPNMPKLQDQRGSPAYISPEVLSAHPYRGKPSDMWALGIVLFTMLYGHFPFYDKVPLELFKKIRAAKFNIPRELPVSENTVELIHGLLHLDPDARFTSRKVLTFLTAVISSRAVLDVMRLSPPPQVVPDIDDKLKEALRNRIRRFTQSTSIDGTALPGSLGSLFFPISPPPTPLLPQVPRGILHHYPTVSRPTAGNAGVYQAPLSQPSVPPLSSASTTSSAIPSNPSLAASSQPLAPPAADNMPSASSPPLLLEADRSQQRLHHRLQQLQIIPPNRVLISSANPDELQVVPDIVDSRTVPRGSSSTPYNSNMRGVPGSPNPVNAHPHHFGNSYDSTNSRLTSISFSPFTPLSSVISTISSRPSQSPFRARVQHPLLRGRTAASQTSDSSPGILHTVPSAQSPSTPDQTNGEMPPSRSISLPSPVFPSVPPVTSSSVESEPEISRSTLQTTPHTTLSLSSASHLPISTDISVSSPQSVLNLQLVTPLVSSTSTTGGSIGTSTTSSSSHGITFPNLASAWPASTRTTSCSTAPVTTAVEETKQPAPHFLQCSSLLLNSLDGESSSMATPIATEGSEPTQSDDKNNLDNLIHSMRESRSNYGPPQPCHSHTNLARAMAGNAFGHVSREDASVLTVPPVVPTTLGLTFTRGAGQQAGSLIARSYGDLTPLTAEQLLAVRDLLPSPGAGGIEPGTSSGNSISLLPRPILGPDPSINVLNRPSSSSAASSLIHPNLSTDPVTGGPLWHRLNMNHRLSTAPHLTRSWTYSGSTVGRPPSASSGQTVRTPTISLQSVRSPAASLSRLLIARRQQQQQNRVSHDARSFSSVRNTSATDALQQQQQQLREAMFYYSSLNNSSQQGVSSTAARSPNIITTNGPAHLVTSTRTTPSSIASSTAAASREIARNQSIAGALSTLFAFSETPRTAEPISPNSNPNEIVNQIIPGSHLSSGLDLFSIGAAQQPSTAGSSYTRFAHDTSYLRNTLRNTMNLPEVLEDPSISTTPSTSSEQHATRTGVAATTTVITTTTTSAPADLVTSSGPTLSYSSLNSATSRLRARRNARTGVEIGPSPRRSTRPTQATASEPLMLGLFSARTPLASVGQRSRREPSSNHQLRRRVVHGESASEVSTAANDLNSVAGDEVPPVSCVLSGTNGIAATTSTSSSITPGVNSSTSSQSSLERTLSESESASD